jgi:hypothetical protein
MDIKINITHGTLKDRIPLSRVNGINSLSLIGSINGDDIEFIRRITGGYDWTDNSKFPGPLEVLDLSNCKFVSGGIYKHTEFMGPYKHSVSLHQFLQMWVSHEYGGNGYGLKFIADDEIPNEMFLGCFKLKKIILPNTITNFEIDCFRFFDKVEKIYYNGTLEDWINITFESKYSNPMSICNNFYLLDEKNEYYLLDQLIINSTHNFYLSATMGIQIFVFCLIGGYKSLL